MCTGKWGRLAQVPQVLRVWMPLSIPSVATPSTLQKSGTPQHPKHSRRRQGGETIWIRCRAGLVAGCHCIARHAAVRGQAGAGAVEGGAAQLLGGGWAGAAAPLPSPMHPHAAASATPCSFMHAAPAALYSIYAATALLERWKPSRHNAWLSESIRSRVAGFHLQAGQGALGCAAGADRVAEQPAAPAGGDGAVLRSQALPAGAGRAAELCPGSSGGRGRQAYAAFGWVSGRRLGGRNGRWPARGRWQGVGAVERGCQVLPAAG